MIWGFLNTVVNCCQFPIALLPTVVLHCCVAGVCRRIRPAGVSLLLRAFIKTHDGQITWCAMLSQSRLIRDEKLSRRDIEGQERSEARSVVRAAFSFPSAEDPIDDTRQSISTVARPKSPIMSPSRVDSEPLNDGVFRWCCNGISCEEHAARLRIESECFAVCAMLIQGRLRWMTSELLAPYCPSSHQAVELLLPSVGGTLDALTMSTALVTDARSGGGRDDACYCPPLDCFVLSGLVLAPRAAPNFMMSPSTSVHGTSFYAVRSGERAMRGDVLVLINGRRVRTVEEVMEWSTSLENGASAFDEEYVTVLRDRGSRKVHICIYRVYDRLAIDRSCAF